jgi:hypothetical protein
MISRFVIKVSTENADFVDDFEQATENVLKQVKDKISYLLDESDSDCVGKTLRDNNGNVCGELHVYFD